MPNKALTSCDNVAFYHDLTSVSATCKKVPAPIYTTDYISGQIRLQKILHRKHGFQSFLKMHFEMKDMAKFDHI